MAENNAMHSLVSFRSNGLYSPVTAVSQVELQAVSGGARWQGLHMELGVAESWSGDDLMANGHFLSMNTNDAMQHLRVRDERRPEWTSYERLPGALWIHPEGCPFSLRLNHYSKWNAVIIDGKFLDSVLGGHYELHAGVNVTDPVIEHLFRALIGELLNPSPNGEVTQSLIRSFAFALGSRQGHKAEDLAAKSRLNDAQLAALLTWVAERLDRGITVGAMAAHVGLSAAHFSREFKRSTGRTPWEHVVELRLQRARLLLEQGETVCSTALQCGFFDQAHFSRVFRQRYELSPSAYVRKSTSASVA
jgi:AraC family transcriptional regulator